MSNLNIGLNQSHRVIGRKFGRLLCGEPTRHRAKNGSILYLAKCECGNNTLVKVCDLKSGATQSCGCLKKESSVANGHKRFVDMSGQKIGKLRILFRDGSTEGKRINPIYVCWCDCGNVCRIAAPNLRKKRPVKSCGCSKIQPDLTGQKFTRLTVRKKVRNARNTGYSWLCQCECGKQTTVDAHLLKKGRVKSCGCLNKEQLLARAKARLIDLSGKRFGNLVVDERNGTYGSGRDSKPLWHCECDCGEFIDVTGNALTMGKKYNCGYSTNLSKHNYLPNKKHLTQSKG